MARGGGAAPTNLGGSLGDGTDKLAGPLYTGPVPNSSLGAEPTGGPTSGKGVADPLGYLGKTGRKRGRK